MTHEQMDALKDELADTLNEFAIEHEIDMSNTVLKVYASPQSFTVIIDSNFDAQ